MAHTYSHPRPSVTTDILVFSIRECKLHVLLIKRGIEPFLGQWAIPGGFLKMDEELEVCAARELREETGLSDLTGISLTQFRTYGAIDRDPRGRTISVAYLTLVPSDHLIVQGMSDASDARWFNYDDLPPLAFDHAQILADGRAHLALLVNPKVSRKLAGVAFKFLPEVFTLPELEDVFVTLSGSGKKVDRRNFRKWFRAMWPHRIVGKRPSGSAGRPSDLYQLDMTQAE
ncbi:NUDIX domain-containing protein [Seohaeicola sp. SP36]|uniref:NUDIX domain-containing protein n=1 Tax=unclassified Seohaeicola TaxID=2641111 RepID=UPI00237AB999|nr:MULTISPECIES: NUDIX domain-containing protein [unclassified Seohaeicola]MDD9709829.1 NUDIX domain-containing protein [Seohaeicola sp. 4SK31]MDD9738090.1 NUDIX domain-containing protein [Seohaeicola sp. SP36]